MAWSTFEPGHSDQENRAIGYSLTGVTTEQCAFIGYGAGSNGKSTFYETVGDLLGNYACNAPFSTFESKDRESISTDVARLEGKRFVRASETNDGKRLNEARIKALTGDQVARVGSPGARGDVVGPAHERWRPVIRVRRGTSVLRTGSGF